MSHTHINAYVQDLTDARDRAVAAVGEFQTAKAAVEAHPDFDKDLHSIRLPFEVLYPKPKVEDPKPATPPRVPKEATA
jgi:hypothetical protein